MTAATRALVAVSATLAARDDRALDDALRHAAEVCGPGAVEEALIQSYLFLGYPAALNGLARWRSLPGVRAGDAMAPADGVTAGVDEAPAPDGANGADEAPEVGARWSRRGAEVCQAVYGGQYDRLRANIRRLHPDMERWMVEEGYGRVLGRPGLPLPERELCIVAILAVQDVPRQLYSHLRGALNVGATVADVEEALAVAAEWSEGGARARAADTWASLKDRRDRGD